MVGLAGGVGSGKSTVAGLLEELGAGVISSDELSHQEINTREVANELSNWWGQDIQLATGEVDRGKVAAIIFKDPTQRLRLESLLHPRIAARRERLVAELNLQPRAKMIVLDTPLLFETGLDKLCDAVIYVEAGLDNRKGRSQKSRDWSEDELARRENLQLPLDIKRSRADYVCNNNSTLSDLRNQVERIFAQILANKVVI